MPKNVLSPKKKLFISKYADPESDTFGNAKASAQAAKLGGTPGSCSVLAHRVLSEASVQLRVDEILTQYGASEEVRMSVLGAVLRGEHLSRTSTRTTGVDRDGNSIEHKTVQQRSPTAAEIIKANQLVERMRGTFDRNKEIARAAGRNLSHLYAQQRKALKLESKPGGAPKTGQGEGPPPA